MSARGVRAPMTARAMAIAVAATFAWSCERADPEPTPAPAAPRVQLKLRYAAKTENASDGTNATYFSIVDDDSLFIVADTAPAGGPDRHGDASRLVAEAMSPSTSPCLAARMVAPELTMQCALDQANAALLAANPKLRASLAAIAIHDGLATIATAGDATVLILHRESFTVLAPARGPLDGADEPPLALRRVRLQAGDTIALVNRPVLDLLGPSRLQRALDASGPAIHAIETSLGQLLDDANRHPDHPALSAIIVRAVEPNAP